MHRVLLRATRHVEHVWMSSCCLRLNFIFRISLCYDPGSCRCWIVFFFIFFVGLVPLHKVFYFVNQNNDLMCAAARWTYTLRFAIFNEAWHTHNIFFCFWMNTAQASKYRTIFILSLCGRKSMSESIVYDFSISHRQVAAKRHNFINF